MKKKSTRLPLISSMMIVAQLLLMILTIHWLNMQYGEHKKTLMKDISELWMRSQQQMIDSLILKQYINPMIDSTTHFNFQFEFNTDSLQRYSSLERDALMNMEVPPIHLPVEESKIIVKVSDSVKVKAFTKHDDPSFFKRDLVLKGVKLFVNEFSDSSFNGQNMAAWAMDSDTNLFKSTFTKEIAGFDPKIRILWKTQDFPDSSFFQAKPPPHLQMVTGDKSIEANIEGYSLMILAKMLPQIGFALLLVILTALAFLLSHRSLRTQELLNIQRNDFIRNMSHELKTPVATVKVALEALKKYDRSNDPHIMNEYLDMATSEADRLELLINRVMSISDNGDAFLSNPVEVNMKVLLSGVLHTLKPRLDSEQAEIILEFPGDECVVMADPLHVSGVLINLLDNSLKYSTAPARISITLKNANDFIHIEVADKGIGVPEEFRDKIFEKFFRAPTGDIHDVKGYGLGLSYARTVMHQHHGSITYRSVPEGGSIFTLIFPKKKS
ncbi:MAG: HAMP domain-containing histidine kinase [Bacteroidales bacterium]|nr:HAMP domain-containing histidine kinase [Bacteroidales bacterium]